LLLRATLAGAIKIISATWLGSISLFLRVFKSVPQPQHRSPFSSTPSTTMASPSKSSAFSGAISRKPSHPMYIQGPFDIIEYVRQSSSAQYYFYLLYIYSNNVHVHVNTPQGEHKILDGQNYGQFNYTTSLIWNHANGKQHAIAIDLSGYSSRAALFDKDMVYCLAGRFVGGKQQPSDDAREPAMFFESAFDLCMGSSSAYIDKNERSLLAGKVAVTGYGVVIDRQSVPGDNPNPDLRVVLRHTDYHTGVSNFLFLCFFYCR
jgi:hypothetical protein